MSKYVYATGTFRVADYRPMIVKGSQHPAGADYVKRNPSMFVSEDEYFERTQTPKSTADLGDRSMSARDRSVEQATAAPGEKRSTKRPAKS